MHTQQLSFLWGSDTVSDKQWQTVHWSCCALKYTPMSLIIQCVLSIKCPNRFEYFRFNLFFNFVLFFYTVGVLYGGSDVDNKLTNGYTRTSIFY